MAQEDFHGHESEETITIQCGADSIPSQLQIRLGYCRLQTTASGLVVGIVSAESNAHQRVDIVAKIQVIKKAVCVAQLALKEFLSESFLKDIETEFPSVQ